MSNELKEFLKEQRRQKQLKSGPAPNTEARRVKKILTELSGTSSQHEVAQSIHAGWDTIV